MKKQLVIILIATVALSLVACNGGKTGDTVDETQQTEVAETETAAESTDTETEEVSAEPEAAPEGPYTFENGVYTCKTFSITVPNGWVLDESYADETSAKFLNAASVEDFDDFSNASLYISVEEYAYQDKEGDYNLDSLVENDRQFFVDDNPTIEDCTWDIYTGKLLSGDCSSFKGCTLKHYDMENWQDGTNNRSRLQVRTYEYTDDDAAALMSIMDSVIFTPEGDEEETSTDEAVTAEAPVVEGADVVLPEGWYVEDTNAFGVDVTNDKFESGYVSITSTPSYDDTAQTEAEKTAGNFTSGDFTPEPLEVNGVTWYGFCPTESQAYYFAQTADGSTIVKFSTMFITLEQAMEVLEGITVQ